MTDFSPYKVDLDTPQPGGRKGESPRSWGTKYNSLIDELSAEIDGLSPSPAIYGYFRISEPYPIPSATHTYVNFDNVVYSAGASRDTSKSPNVFRVTKPGIYAVMGTTRFDGLPTFAYMSLTVANAGIPTPSQMNTTIAASPANHRNQSITGMFRCTNPDSGFLLAVYQNSGSAQDLPVSDTSLSIFRLGDAT